ncbi:7589_t:CDS:2, partial [Ambispora leptoticha]
MNKFNSFRWLKPKTSFALLCNRNFLKNPSQRRTLIAREFNTSQITTNQPSSQAIDEEPVHQGEHYIQVPKRGLMELAGEDTMKFLQGLITNDIKSMNTGVNVFYTAFLNSMGRVLFDAFIYQKNGSPEPVFLVECDLRIIPEFTKHLKKYLLRSKVAIKDVSSEYKIWNIWGNKNILDNLTLNSTLPKSGYVDQRCAGMGLRIVMPANMKPNLTSNFTELPSEEYVIRRILHGVPEGIDDFVPEKALPLQSNFDYMGGIDFRKGCYIGQELTFRTYHTGVTRRRILPIQLYPFDAT